MARPSGYSDELGLKICSLIAHGKSLVSICSDEGMPSVETVYLWLRDERYKEFLNTYTRAREDQADTLSDEIIDISDEATVTVREQDGFTEVVFDSTAVARNRLRVESRKWVASKLKPKKYGDRLLHAGDPEQPIKHTHTIGFEDSAADLLSSIRESSK
jgi:hypothetical protein